MKTATMDEILRQRDPDLKAAVQASLAGDMRKAFEKLGSNVAEVNPDNIAGAVAARWLRLSPEARENTGVMAPSHDLRQRINAHIRERLAREGRIHGPAMQSQRLVSLGYTHAEKALAANYGPGDVVAFRRPYKRLGVEKGKELRVAEVDHEARTVRLEGRDGQPVLWEPGRLAARSGGVEVYKVESMELRAGDRIRWNPEPRRSRTGQQTDRRGDKREERPCDLPSGGRAGARHEDGRSPVAPYRPRLGLDRACVPGADGGQRHRGHGGGPPATDHPEELLRGNQPGQGPSGAP